MATFNSQVCDTVGAASDLNHVLGHGVLEVLPYALGQGGSCVYSYSAAQLAQLGDLSSITNTLGYIVGVAISVQYQSGGADAQWDAAVGSQDVKVTPLPQLGARAAAVASNDGTQYYESFQDSDGVTVRVAAGIPTSQAGVLDKLKPLVRVWLQNAMTDGRQYLSAANSSFDSGRTMPPPSGITDADVQTLMTECPGFAALGGQDWVDLSLTSPAEGSYILQLAQQGACDQDIEQWPNEAEGLN